MFRLSYAGLNSGRNRSNKMPRPPSSRPHDAEAGREPPSHASGLAPSALIHALDDLQPDPLNANRGTDRGRAIDPAAVERMFDATRGAHISPSDLEHNWRGQPGPPAERAGPDPAGARYCIGIDWAQKRDDTVAAVVRCETTPLQVVAVYRNQRRSWQVMTEHVGALLDEYPGPAAHDATGAGNTMEDFLGAPEFVATPKSTPVPRIQAGAHEQDPRGRAVPLVGPIPPAARRIRDHRGRPQP